MIIPIRILKKLQLIDSFSSRGEVFLKELYPTESILASEPSRNLLIQNNISSRLSKCILNACPIVILHVYKTDGRQ